MNDQPTGFSSAVAELPIPIMQVGSISQASRHEMLSASKVIVDCQRALSKAGFNVVGEVIKGHEGFFEMNHYPDGDVFDQESHAQYYYHAHREGGLEHGHFHTFMRAQGIASGVTPMDYPKASEEWPRGDQAIAHLIAISMDPWGLPIGLFACNRWVTGETWYSSTDTINMLKDFSVDHAYPSWPTNLWLTSMLRLFRPQIEALLTHRDMVVGAWQHMHPEHDALEDRTLEITGYLSISVEEWVSALQA